MIDEHMRLVNQTILLDMSPELYVLDQVFWALEKYRVVLHISCPVLNQSSIAGPGPV